MDPLWLRNLYTKWTLVICIAGLGTGCDSLLIPGPDPTEILEGPIEGLSPSQNALHLKGDEDFGKVFGVVDGLGPVFVAQSCSGCHPGDGKGHPLNVLTRFGAYQNGTWTELRHLGGPQLQHRSLPGMPGEQIPWNQPGIRTAQFIAPHVMGLGFLEAVTDQEILSRVDSLDLDGNGIKGIPQWVPAPDWYKPGPDKVVYQGMVLGKFGRKAGAVDLRHQVANAYLEDMGITSELNPHDLVVPGSGGATDGVPDPEVSLSELANVVFYLQTLRTPPRRNTEDPGVISGGRIFTLIGCADCHVPQLKTGNSPISALSQKVIYPYTDLLMHDMGPDLDPGYREGSVGSKYWRTTPLWGLGLSHTTQGGAARYMHDGRAKTLDQAILLHGGEASNARTAYNNLTAAEKQDLIKFLNSL